MANQHTRKTPAVRRLSQASRIPRQKSKQPKAHAQGKPLPKEVSETLTERAARLI